MQKARRHTRMEALVVMQEASRPLARRHATNKIVANEKSEAESGVTSKKLRVRGEPQGARDLD